MKRFLPALLMFLMVQAGCHEPEVVESEPKRPDDQITEAELESFLSIVDSLPERRLPALPQVIPPAPRWSSQRTLPVSELLKEEEKLLSGRQLIDRLAAHCPQSRFMKRALRREKMTIEQFLGLYVALGLSLCRDGIPMDRDLDQILARAKRAVADLRKDERPFSSLPEDEAYFVREQSGWIAVVQRSVLLKEVHPYNARLARNHRERLTAVLPAEFSENPFREFGTILDERGIPFQELPGQESDDNIPWSREQALVGTDSAGDGEGP